MVGFRIRGYGYGYYVVSAGNNFAGMDIGYPYPSPVGYMTCGPRSYFLSRGPWAVSDESVQSRGPCCGEVVKTEEAGSAGTGSLASRFQRATNQQATGNRRPTAKTQSPNHPTGYRHLETMYDCNFIPRTCFMMYCSVFATSTTCYGLCHYGEMLL